mgnify:CR=1 FL=1
MSAVGNNSQNPALQDEGPIKRFFRATEIDMRLLGMVAALLLIWCAFDIASGILRGNFGGLLGGSFLTPRNLWTLLVQGPDSSGESDWPWRKAGAFFASVAASSAFVFAWASTASTRCTTAS